MIMRLTLCRGAPSSCSSSSWYDYGMRTIVQVRRVRGGLPPDPVPFVLHKVCSALSSSTLARACWRIPAGGEALLCCSSCLESRSNGSGRVPRCLEWVRFSHNYLGQGPAGGRLLALKVSSRIRGSPFARCWFKSFARYVVARCSWAFGVCVPVGLGTPVWVFLCLWVCPGCAVSA